MCNWGPADHRRYNMFKGLPQSLHAASQSLFTGSRRPVNSVYKQIVGREGSYLHFGAVYNVYRKQWKTPSIRAMSFFFGWVSFFRFFFFSD